MAGSLRQAIDTHTVGSARTVNTVFRFSQLWCLGVDYVTTEYPQSFVSMGHPAWSMALILYEGLCQVGTVAGFLMFLFLHARRTHIDRSS